MRYLLLLILGIGVLNAKSQFVTTILNSGNIQIDDAIIQDQQGNIYGSHYMGSNVYKIGVNGVVSIFKGGLNTPNALALDSYNNLYIVDNIGNRIYKLDSAGNQLLSIPINSPSGIIKDINSDTMIFTQYSGHRIRKLAPNGIISPNHIFSGSPLNGPVGLCYGSDSVLYVGNFGNRKIHRFKNNSIQYVATVPGNPGSLGFIAQANGLIYGTGFQSNKIYEINPNYIDSVNIFSGSSQGNADGSLSAATFNSPNGIFASKGGDSLIVSDYNTGNIRMISGLLTNSRNKNILIKNVKIYPNPSTDYITIETEEHVLRVEIVDIMGKLVFEKERFSGNRIIIKNNLESGTYFIRIIGPNKNVVNRKILVK